MGRFESIVITQRKKKSQVYILYTKTQSLILSGRSMGMDVDCSLNEKRKVIKSECVLTLPY